MATNPGRIRWASAALVLGALLTAAAAFSPSPKCRRTHLVSPPWLGSPLQSSTNGDGGGGRRNRRKPRLPSKNLYSILGADPTMSRQEIKRLYITLAKQTHPDSSNAAESDRFNEIAQAWEVISDSRSRRAYDRELAAQDFKEDVAKRAGELANEYGPAAQKLFDDVAIPFLRRTTATTLAGWSAVTEATSDVASERIEGESDANISYRRSGATLSEVKKEMSEMERSGTGAGDALEDFGKAFQRVIEAGRNATRRIDGMELQEKSLELRQRADDTRAESMMVLEQLAEIKSERLRLTFRTPSADFTSVDAVQFLEGYNSQGIAVDDRTLVQRMTLKHPIIQDVEAFAEAETEFDRTLGEKSYADQRMEEQRQALERAERDALSALQAEERARKMLEEAQRQVAECQRIVAETQQSMQVTEMEVNSADYNLSKADTALKRKRDVVRRELKRKADKVEGNMSNEASMNAMGFEDSSEERNLAAIEGLSAEERRIEGEFLRLVEKASRLVSRSERLWVRSEELIGEQMAEAQANQSGGRGSIVGE
ncbi:hypothetical protein ACHAXT_002298 [Thalassiosira profunda]